MKTLIYAAILALIMYAAPAFSQEPPHPEVPQTKVAELAKPFIGSWAAVACDSREPRPYGLRFQIRVDTIKTPDGDKLAPVLTMEDIEPIDGDTHKIKPFDFQTMGFFDLPNGPQLLAANPNLAVALEHSKLNDQLVVTLDGNVRIFSDGTEYSVYAIPDPGHNWDYVTPLSAICGQVNKGSDDGVQNQVRFQHIAYHPTADESDDEINAAIDEFNAFVNAHVDKIDIAVLGRADVNSPWFARFYQLNNDGSVKAAWNNEGYPKARMVVHDIEHNFNENPDGKDETFREEPNL